jgi:F-type H+-transporting ATPase subunit a
MHDIPIKAEEIFRIGGFAITNTLLVSTIAAALLLLFGFFIRRSLRLIPGKVQVVCESLVEGLLNLMDMMFERRAVSERYFPFIATLFLFIVTSNLLGLLPGIGSIVITRGDEHIPLLRSPATDLNFTLALALSAVVVSNLIGFTVLGIRQFGKKYINFKNPLYFFVGILELVSEIAKVASLSLRLFGNIFAGEVLLTSIGLIFAYILPLPFIMMEILVAVIQAFVFSMLTMVFIAINIKHEEAH